jgi:hypothetical protein
MATRKPRPRLRPAKSALVSDADIAARPGAERERRRVDAMLVRRVRAMRTAADLEGLLDYAHPLDWYEPGKRLRVADQRQARYSYALAAAPGADFPPEFRPALTPGEVLARGAFGGDLVCDCVLELPREWLADAILAGRLNPAGADSSSNEFGVASTAGARPGSPPDPRGWFQWYCRYWLGRRGATDADRIAEWKSAVARRVRQVEKAGGKRAPKSRAEKRTHAPRARQGLLQLAADPYT